MKNILKNVVLLVLPNLLFALCNESTNGPFCTCINNERVCVEPITYKPNPNPTPGPSHEHIIEDTVYFNKKGEVYEVYNNKSDNNLLFKESKKKLTTEFTENVKHTLKKENLIKEPTFVVDTSDKTLNVKKVDINLKPNEFFTVDKVGTVKKIKIEGTRLKVYKAKSKISKSIIEKMDKKNFVNKSFEQSIMMINK